MQIFNMLSQLINFDIMSLHQLSKFRLFHFKAKNFLLLPELHFFKIVHHFLNRA